MNINIKLEPYKNVIFDVGNVLLEWRPEKIFKEAWGITENLDFYNKSIFGSDDWVLFDKGEATDEETFEFFRKKLGCSYNHMEKLISVARRSLVPIKESINLLNTLSEQKINLYALTNMPKSSFSFLYEKYDFWDKFIDIVVSSHVYMVKPDIEIFLYCIQKNDLIPNQTIFLDDTLKNVETANRLGMAGIHFINASDCMSKMINLVKKVNTKQEL